MLDVFILAISSIDLYILEKNSCISASCKNGSLPIMLGQQKVSCVTSKNASIIHLFWRSFLSHFSSHPSLFLDIFLWRHTWYFPLSWLCFAVTLQVLQYKFSHGLLRNQLIQLLMDGPHVLNCILIKLDWWNGGFLQSALLSTGTHPLK